MVSVQIVRDGAVGETREALIQDGRAVGLRVWRWSDDGRRARWGEVYAARITAVDAQRRGAFCALGLGDEQGFLPIGAKPAPAVREGALVCVDIVREAARGKSAVVALRAQPATEPPRRLSQPDCDLELAQAKPADGEIRARLDAMFDDALNDSAPIPGGGVLHITPTPALVAIDVDAQARTGSRDAERFALDLNIAAVREALRQLRLRSLGGIIALDCVAMRRHENRLAVYEEARTVAKLDPWGVRVARLSPFGVLEMSRGQMCTPLHEVMGDAAQTTALAALRRVESAARSARGRIVEAYIPEAAMAWLDRGVIAWRDALTQRIGARWTIRAHATPGAGMIDVALT